MDIATIQNLFEYNAWANQRTLEGCATLSSEQLLQPMGGSFGSLRNTLAHIMDVEWLYLERWQGRAPAAFPKAENYPTLADITERWQTVDSDMDRFVKALTPAALQEIIEFRNTRGKLFHHPLWETMQHLVNHSTYHRGQVTMLVRQLGATPKSSDMIYFYRQRSGQPTA